MLNHQPIKLLIRTSLVMMAGLCLMHSTTVLAEMDTTSVVGTFGKSMLIEKTVKPYFKKINREPTDKQNAEHFYRSAIKHLGAGDMEKAENNLTLSLSFDDNHHSARQLLATIYSRSERKDSAISILQTKPAYGANGISSSLLLANLLADKDDIKGAIKVLERVAPAGKLSKKYYATLAAFYYQDTRFNDAYDIYRSLLKKNPNNSIWWMGLGVTLDAVNAQGAALKAYKHAKENGLGKKSLVEFVERRIKALVQSGADSMEEQAG